MNNNELLKIAIDNLKNAYAPYSNFAVSAIVVTSDDSIFKGVNIENISFGATICAERSAIASAISNGYKKKDLKKILLVASENKIITPCGICRQVIYEFFAPESEVIMCSSSGDMKIKKIYEMLPDAFDNAMMERK